MTARKVIVTSVALLAVGLGAAGCRDTPPAPTQSGADELGSVRTTLDAIDSEVAGDGSP